MKTCSLCNQELSNDSFYPQKGKKNGCSRCKTCYNKSCSERWVKLKIEVIKKFNSICHDCKQSYHYSVFDFHHKDPSEKEYSWHKMRLISKAKREKELSKCIMLCANCHRIRHYDKS